MSVESQNAWDKFEEGCLATYSGGHHRDGQLEAYQHGMNTVFNILRAHYPSPRECKSSDIYLSALKLIANGFNEVKSTEDGGWLPNWSAEDAKRFDEIARGAIAKATITENGS